MNQLYNSIFLLLLVLSVASHGFAQEISARGNVKIIDRFHRDTGEYNTVLEIDAKEIAYKHNLTDTIMLEYDETLRTWTLEHSDGMRYVQLDQRIHTPHFLYSSANSELRASLSLVDITHHSELYERIENDQQEMFYLPDVSAHYSVDRLFFSAGGWVETDLQTFDYLRYCVAGYSNMFLGAGLNMTDRQSLELKTTRNERIYPEDYTLQKQSVLFKYTLKDIFKYQESFIWKFLTLEFNNIYYPDVTVREMTFLNLMTFNLLDVSQFFVYKLFLGNYITEYTEGVFQYSLVENDVEKEHARHMFEYSGFVKLNPYSFYLSWLLSLEQSTQEGGNIERTIRLKTSYVF